MRKIVVALATGMVLWAGCENDLNLTAPWKDIPVVFGIISPVDTAHYIRIEKAFLDPQRSALEIARIPDSLYYEDLSADLIEVSSGKRIALQKVDGAAEGYPRADGVFAEEPNILYKTTESIQAGEQYRLEINRDDNLPHVTAQTMVVGRPTIQSPGSGASLRFHDASFFRVSWTPGQGAAFYDVILYFNYSEYHVSDPGTVFNRTVGWKMSGNLTATEFQVPGSEFYAFLKSAIPVDPGLRRQFQSIDIQVRSGGAELYEFQRVQLANSGITSAGGDIPQYTNLSEGVGVFSSSHRQTVTGYGLHPETRQQLINGPVTADLNFQ